MSQSRYQPPSASPYYRHDESSNPEKPTDSYWHDIWSVGLLGLSAKPCNLEEIYEICATNDDPYSETCGDLASSETFDLPLRLTAKEAIEHLVSCRSRSWGSAAEDQTTITEEAPTPSNLSELSEDVAGECECHGGLLSLRLATFGYQPTRSFGPEDDLRYIPPLKQPTFAPLKAWLGQNDEDIMNPLPAHPTTEEIGCIGKQSTQQSTQDAAPGPKASQSDPLNTVHGFPSDIKNEDENCYGTTGYNDDGCKIFSTSYKYVFAPFSRIKLSGYWREIGSVFRGQG
ncbi:hypothetical protein TWF481_002752 [Arthrobotrys musiformis]|uniref:Uncharacterized protein n=1 Tax=Arthrobotrys musiformis TaxID=47236 RepID=A0AAV9VR88_9PEZI